MSDFREYQRTKIVKAQQKELTNFMVVKVRLGVIQLPLPSVDNKRPPKVGYDNGKI